MPIPRALAEKRLEPSAQESAPALEESTSKVNYVPAAPEFLQTFSDELHVYVREYIALADQKAAFLFTSVTALLAYFQLQGVVRAWLFAPSVWSLVGLLPTITSGCLFISALRSLAVILPRFGGAPKGIIFFRAIISTYRSSEEYVASVESKHPQELVKARLLHVYELAAICDKKYSALNSAMCWGVAGLGMAALYFLID